MIPKNCLIPGDGRPRERRGGFPRARPAAGVGGRRRRPWFEGRSRAAEGPGPSFRSGLSVVGTLLRASRCSPPIHRRAFGRTCAGPFPRGAHREGPCTPRGIRARWRSEPVQRGGRGWVHGHRHPLPDRLGRGERGACHERGGERRGRSRRVGRRVRAPGFSAGATSATPKALALPSRRSSRECASTPLRAIWICARAAMTSENTASGSSTKKAAAADTRRSWPPADVVTSNQASTTSRAAVAWPRSPRKASVARRATRYGRGRRTAARRTPPRPAGSAR